MTSFMEFMLSELHVKLYSTIHLFGNKKECFLILQACAAYSFITIPSLTSIFGRLHLYLASGQVALLNQCLSQADAFFKAAISLIPEIPKTIELDGKNRNSEPLILDFVNNLLSTLLIVPVSRKMFHERRKGH